VYQKSASAFDGASGDVNANSTAGGSEQMSTALRRADDVTDAHASPGNRVGDDDVTSGVERRRTGGVRAEPARDVIHTTLPVVRTKSKHWREIPRLFSVERIR